MTQAMQDLDLEHLWVVYPGDKEYPLGDRMSAIPLGQFPSWRN